MRRTSSVLSARNHLMTSPGFMLRTALEVHAMAV
eukprot:CAMPEP_0179212380 /NCGR_PEP_ID=MMETSP0797-20121207/1081_1 /TAXON_ID=47934 /ORGANISM="Dinophysis acuminata, Strain DAEP01" /LENGTH=33 /DNA_ID= /DNA_START= /DNA_END= /DNA_ORIENTATION=